jgi:hypothetical protein
MQLYRRSRLTVIIFVVGLLYSNFDAINYAHCHSLILLTGITDDNSLRRIICADISGIVQQPNNQQAIFNLACRK